MKRVKLIWIPALLLFALGMFARPWILPTTAVAAPQEQGLLQLPVEFYLLMNQPGDLWLVRINLTDVYLRGVDLSGANLTEANLTRAHLREASLEEARLISANLTSAILREANLTGADLTSANLSRADLRGADLTGAILESTNFNRARYNADTLWPEDFDVTATNAELVE